MRAIINLMYPPVLLMFFLIFLGGCSSSGPVKVQVDARADVNINRDESGRSLSVVVKLYQLKSQDAFGKLTFDVLASGRQESELLGSDLIASNELMLVPGGRVDLQDVLQENTRFVGAVAFLRSPDPHYWRVLVDARDVRKQGFSLRLSDCYLRVVKPDPVLLPGQPPVPTGTCQRLPAARRSAGPVR